jgi:hypothetical protein
VVSAVTTATLAATAAAIVAVALTLATVISLAAADAPTTVALNANAVRIDPEAVVDLAAIAV